MAREGSNVAGEGPNKYGGVPAYLDRGVRVVPGGGGLVPRTLGPVQRGIILHKYGGLVSTDGYKGELFCRRMAKQGRKRLC